MTAPAWTVVDAAGRACCLRCGVRRKIQRPLLIDFYVEQLRLFEITHASCKRGAAFEVERDADGAPVRARVGG